MNKSVASGDTIERKEWITQKSHLLNCKCDTFVNITSPTQLQDGTTYDSINIIHHNYMKSTKDYSSESDNLSLTG